MSQVATKVNVNIRIDKLLKQQVEEIAREMGLTFTAVVNILLAKLTKERTITLHADHASLEPVTAEEWSLLQKESGEVFSRVSHLIRECDEKRGK